MEVLAIFDDGNFDPRWKTIERNAVRAVIIRDGKIALVKSGKEGYFKFPGGGIENGETHLQTLCRETMEEAGLKIRAGSVREIGMIREIRKSITGENEIFDQKSYYYFAEAEDLANPVSLDGYEAELEFMPEWIDIKEAYEIDIELGRHCRTKFILREAFVLGMLLGVSWPPD